MTIEKELARIDALIEAREKATQGEWKYDDGNHQVEGVDSRFGVCDIITEVTGDLNGRDPSSYWGNDGEFIALAANELKPLLENYKRALEVVRYYADSTNFEAVNNGRNYQVEEYNKITVSGDDMGSAARAFLQSLEQNENN